MADISGSKVAKTMGGETQGEKQAALFKTRKETLGETGGEEKATKKRKGFPGGWQDLPSHQLLDIKEKSYKGELKKRVRTIIQQKKSGGV